MIFLIILFLILVTFILLVVALKEKDKPAVSLTERLKAASQPNTAKVSSVRDEEKMKKSLVERVLIPLSAKLSTNMEGIMPAGMVQKSQQKIAEAGLSDKVTGTQLTTMSYMLMVGLTALIAALAFPNAAQGHIEQWHAVAATIIACILGYRLPVGIVTSRASARKHEIQKSLPFTFDLISISVEAGMSFDGAIQAVAERTKGPLTEELQRSLREINLGILREEALANLGKRTGVEDLRSFITAVNYITKLGGSLVEVIRIQTEAMRIKRRQRAEKLAAQAPVKIMIPLVMFILPCIFIVVLAPGFLKVAKLMGGAL